MDEQLCGATAALREARTVAVLTGAGVSAESGISTFRDADGLWSRFSPEEMASIDGFMANPQRVWEWYQYRHGVIESAEPNPAHRALARLAELRDLTLVTQNIDGLHQAAGSPEVIELHGNLRRSFCFDCGKPADIAMLPPVEAPVGAPDGAPDGAAGGAPCCACGGLLRPDVVWFGEQLPQRALTRAFAAAQGCDLFLSIGTSAAVFPAAQIPVEAARAGAKLVEINPEPTPLTPLAEWSVQMPAGEALPVMVAGLEDGAREK